MSTVELDTRSRLLSATAELMRHQGYAATGVKAILDASDATAGSLYHFFPGGKEQLAAQAIAAAGQAYRELVEAYFAPGVDLVDAGRAFFVDAADMVETTAYADACPMATVALETADHSEAIREAASAAFTSWIDVVTARAEAAGVAPGPAARLGRELFMLLQGGFLLARVRRDGNPLREAGATAAALAEHVLAR